MKYMKGEPNSSTVIQRLWQMKPGLVQSGLVALFYKDPLSLPRVYQVVSEVRVPGTAFCQLCHPCGVV